MDEYLSLLKDLKVLYDSALKEDWQYIEKYVDVTAIGKNNISLALAKAMDEVIPAYRAGLPVPKITTEYFKALIDTARCSKCGSIYDIALCTGCGRILCPSCCDGCFMEKGGCSLTE